MSRDGFTNTRIESKVTSYNFVKRHGHPDGVFSWTREGSSATNFKIRTVKNMGIEKKTYAPRPALEELRAASKSKG